MSSLLAQKQHTPSRKMNVLQTHENSLKTTNIKGDIACPLFWERGSLTVEAALILPLFLSAVMTLLSFLNVMETAIEHRIRQQDVMKKSAVAAHLLSEPITGKEGDCIKVDLLYPISLPIGGFGYGQVLHRQKGLIHIFNGYNDSCGDSIGTSEEYVYITKTGSVYHRRRSCRILNISVTEVEGEKVFALRNVDRKKYYGCTRCAQGYGESDLKGCKVYITDYGVNYHLSLRCPDLRRMVQVIKITHVGGRTPCKLCS